MRRVVYGGCLAVLAAAFAACGPGNGSGAVSGAPYGFDVRSAFMVTRSGTSPDLILVHVMLLPEPWSCDELKANIAQLRPPYADVQVDRVANWVIPGEYRINANFGSGALAGVEVDGPTGDKFQATRGAITIHSARSDGESGSFDVSDGTTTISGDFDAPPCDAIP